MEEILTRLLELRERLRPYLTEVMAEYTATGVPPMRPLPFAFPSDTALRIPQGAYMLGPKLLVAPVLEPSANSREVCLPTGRDWVHVWTGESYEGGTTVRVSAKLGMPPVFCLAEHWSVHMSDFENLSP